MDYKKDYETVLKQLNDLAFPIIESMKRKFNSRYYLSYEQYNKTWQNELLFLKRAKISRNKFKPTKFFRKKKRYDVSFVITFIGSI